MARPEPTIALAERRRDQHEQRVIARWLDAIACQLAIEAARHPEHRGPLMRQALLIMREARR